MKSNEIKGKGNIYLVLGLLYTVFMLESCYSNVDGCIDPESTNYAIEADVECDDCCTYPSLTLEIFHTNNSETYNLGDSLFTSFNDTFKILGYAYLLSDFRIQGDNGDVFEVMDSLTLLRDDGDTITKKDDIQRVTRSQFQFDLGELVYNGTLTNIAFAMGVDNDVNSFPILTAAEGNPLISDVDSLYSDDLEGYVYQRIQVAQGDSLLDTVVYDVMVPLEFSIEVDAESLRGTNKTIQIEALYNVWFEEANLKEMNKDQIEAVVGQSSIGMFRKRE